MYPDRISPLETTPNIQVGSARWASHRVSNRRLTRITLQIVLVILIVILILILILILIAILISPAGMDQEWDRNPNLPQLAPLHIFACAKDVIEETGAAAVCL